MANKRKARNRTKEIIRRLDKSVDEFNDWRRRNPGLYIELHDHDFSGRDLRGVDFRAARLKNADFSHAILREANFRGANLNDANLARAELNWADFGQSRLGNADLTQATLDGANLYATIRDGWKISGVVCSQCWISKERDQYPKDPDRFGAGEFEIVHSGRRIRVRFPGGFQPVDLLALPYHTRAILDLYKGKRIIFVGLSTVGEAALEFRVEDPESPAVERHLQKDFSSRVTEIRDSTVAHLRTILQIREEQTRDQRKMLDVLSAILVQESAFKGRGDINFLVGGDLNIADEVSYVNVWNQLVSSTDVQKLLAELKSLKSELESESKTEQARDVSQAEQEISSGNGANALRYLKKAGDWAFKTATKIGADVAAAAIKQSLGIP